MGRSRHVAQVGPHCAGGHAVRHHHRRQPDRHGHRAAFDETRAGSLMELAQEEVSGAPPDLRAKRSWRSVKSRMMTCLMVASVCAVALPLVAVVWAVLGRGPAVAFAG